MKSASGDWKLKLAFCVNVLETRLLPAWLPERRWFQAKSSGIEKVSLVDGISAWAVDGLEFVIAFASITTRDGRKSLYQLPLAFSREEPKGVPEPAIIGRLEVEEGEFLTIIDGLAVPAVTLLYLNQMLTKGATATDRAVIEGASFPVIRELLGSEVPEPIGLSLAEQSHSNVILGDRLLLKVFRKLDEGINPDIEIGRFLTERTTFRNAPRLAGCVTYEENDGHPQAAAVLQEFVQSRGQGWEWMLGLLKQAFESSAVDHLENSDHLFKALTPALDDARLLGRRTAELHQALASQGDDHDFTPEAFNAEDWAQNCLQLWNQVEQTQSSLDLSDEVPQELKRQAIDVLKQVLDWLNKQNSQPFPEGAGQKIRIHGDFHLGQTLRTESDYILVDFEGEPSKPIRHRRRKQSPLRDVAGMMRSFDYAVYAALDLMVKGFPERADSYNRTAYHFSPALIHAFEYAYREHAEAAPWSSRGQARELLLKRLLMEKAIYELDYELNNRPAWASIPLRGLQRLLKPRPAL